MTNIISNIAYVITHISAHSIQFYTSYHLLPLNNFLYYFCVLFYNEKYIYYIFFLYLFYFQYICKLKYFFFYYGIYCINLYIFSTTYIYLFFYLGIYKFLYIPVAELNKVYVRIATIKLAFNFHEN